VTVPICHGRASLRPAAPWAVVHAVQPEERAGPAVFLW